MKHKNHPSIIALKEKSKNSKFTFHEVDNENIIEEMKRLSKRKPFKSPIFLPQLLTKTLIFLEVFLAESLKRAIKTFPNCLKLADITPSHKREEKQQGKL